MAQAAVKEDVYVYEGTDKRGQRVKGEVRGANPSIVKADLRRQGVNPLKVKKKPKSIFGDAAKTKKIEAKDIAVLIRQLATMMSSGVPLVQSFDIIAKGQENPAMRDMVLGVKGSIEGGTTLSEALARYPKYFDELAINLVHAGEQAGILEDLLDKIATYKEKSEAIKGKIKKAMFYPTAVLVVAFVITAILLIFVIPQFESLFAGFGAQLPALTLFVIKLSKFFQAYWWLMFGAIGLVIYAFGQAKRRSKSFREALERFSLKIPVMGQILNKAAVARFARTLATMFAAGVPLVDAMESVAGAVGNVVYRTAVLKMRDDVSTGTSLQASMEQAQVFPSMVVQMVAIGEESGSLDTMLGKVADFYEEEVDNLVDALSTLMEPIIMAVLGVLVGGLVVSMYLPIFKMGEAVS